MSHIKQHNIKTKIALITGAGGGIGSAIALKFLEEGLMVCATDVNDEKLQHLSKMILGKTYANNLLALPMDVCDRKSIIKVEQVVTDKWGNANILVNCAGIFSFQPFLETSDDSFIEVMQVNLMGTFSVCQVFAKKMIKNGSGKIINIASVSAFMGASQASAYSASKAGIVALTKSMAKEFAEKNVQVNVVVPGYINTSMSDPYKETLKMTTALRIPSKRLGESWEVAEAVWCLASFGSSYMTGTQIVIDGGLTLG